MTEEKSVLDKDLDKIAATSDPITVMFELNEEMMWRIGRIGYVLTYAFWAGILVAILAAVFFVWTILTEVNFAGLVGSVIVVLTSAIATMYAHRERPFLDEYKVLAGAVGRSRYWKPNPNIPPGSDILERYLKYLEKYDDRFAYYFKNKPKYLHKDFRMETKSGKKIHFDAVLRGSSFPWDPVVEDVRVLIRTVPIATLSEVTSMKDDSEYALKNLGVRFVSKPGPARIVLIQTGKSSFDEAVVEAADENWVHYARRLGNDEVDWSSPIELIAESESGTYNLGTVFFG